MEKPNDTEKLELYMFAKRVLAEKSRGRSLVFVDDKLLEWVDEQVDAGKYYSRSHAIECAVAEIKERGKNKGDGHLAGTSNSLGWNDLDEAHRRFAIRFFVEFNKLVLRKGLRKLFGDNLQAKIYCLKNLPKPGSVSLNPVQEAAFKEVLNEVSERERERKQR